MTKNNRLADYLILLLILLIGMWPIVLGIATMKWDAMDIYLPWKYFVGESIRNGALPLWNPFMNSGFPQMGDVNTWYPVSWMIALFRRYDVYAVHFEYLFHLYLAGIGMYLVAQHYSMSRAARIFVAAAYMFSGFFISNAQHVGWIISAAWLPFIYFYFVQLRAKPGLIVALKLGFCSFMMLSGGYPGIFISAFYLFLAFSIFLFVQFLLKRDFINLRSWLLYLSFSALVFLLLSSVVIVSSLDLAKHVTRGGGLAFDNSKWGILTGSLPPKALLTFVFPYAASINNGTFWGTDFSIINCYMGIIPLLLLIFIFFQKDAPFKARVFSIIGVFFMLTALAQVIPIRKWLYLFLPFMDLFRFSALFRVFAIFFFLLAAGLGLDYILTTKKIGKTLFRYLLIIVAIFGAIQLFLLFRIERWQFKQLLLYGFPGFDKMAGIQEKIFLQGLLQMGIISVILLFLKFRPKYLAFCIVCVSCADMILATQLNIYATVVSNYPVKKVEIAFSKFPEGYPIPSLQLPMKKTDNDALMGSVPYLWQNLAIYHKLPSCDGNSPYSLYTMSTAMGNQNYQATLNYPLLFLATFKDKETVVDTNSIDKKSYEKISVTAFNPNLLSAKIKTDKTQYLVLQQNYYPYWKAIINGEEQVVIKTNDTYMAVQLAPGISNVSFEFKPVKAIVAFFVSLISFILVLLVISWQIIRDKYSLVSGRYLESK
jgi:hypothetical protein